MKEAVFLYKCRLCGEIGRNPRTNENNALFYLIGAILGKQPRIKQAIGTPPEMLDIHSCKDGRTGVSDLIGYEVKE